MIPSTWGSPRPSTPIVAYVSAKTAVAADSVAAAIATPIMHLIFMLPFIIKAD